MSHLEKIESQIEKIKEEGKEFRVEIRTRVMGYIGAGLGVIVSLAWNEAIKALIEMLFPLNKDSLIAKFVYAVLMTAILVFITVYFLRTVEAPNKKKKGTKI